ncbi:hypothetical protein V5740_04590 [Croceibacterium sp. TMG7-5b_MA50]|uniref:hypothetical protein n=1 Tax=Croceibacterium sp. TMG7-5b_MA50 TaxID=3121290 RepID=UPI003222206D
MRRMLATIATAALAGAPTLAAAQDCVTPDEVSAMAIYAVPSAVQALDLRCSTQLASDGFLARGGAGMSRRYAALQGRSWPQAKSGLRKLLGGAAQGQMRGNLDMISGLPDQHVRPLVDALLVQELSARIPVADCGAAERLLETMSQVEPEIAAGLIGGVLGLFAPPNTPICQPARP